MRSSEGAGSRGRESGPGSTRAGPPALLLAAALAALAAIAVPEPSLSAAEARSEGGGKGPNPRIAVVIDDFGLTYPKNVPDERWMGLPWPATYAVMPRSPRTRRAAQETLKAGKELILHMPFDPFLDLELPAGEPSPRDQAKVRALLDDSIETIPGAKGLNNHRSWRATQNRPLMRWFMGELHGRGLYFLDSRVSEKSVAYEEARRAGIPSAMNSLFLDEAKRHDKAFCARMLKAAASRARRLGGAVVIGHHYFWGTYECLAEGVPKLQKEGFEFVFASQLVR